MKFYVGDEELKNVIKNYEVIGNCMIINYLDGSSSKINNTTDVGMMLFKKMTEDKMINQLIERNSSFIPKYRYALLNAPFIFLSLLLVESLGEKLKIPELLPIVIAFGLPFFGYKVFLESEKVVDVKKSNLYLEMHSKLQILGMYDDLQDPKLRLALSNLLGDLSINTLDDYSYDEVKEIHQKIKKL